MRSARPGKLGLGRLAGTLQLRHVPGAMRSTWHIPRATPLLLVTLVVGCEHKSKKDDNTPPPDKAVMGSASATGAAKPADDGEPEPVAKEPAKEAAKEAPAARGGGDEVRPPTAEDLAEYTKDI